MFTCGPLLAAETTDFERDVLPIFQKHCVACHSADEPENDFALENYDQLVAGGKSGVALTAGASASSRLWLMMSGKLQPKMPPEDSSILSDNELELVQRWIDQGAPGPSTAQASMPKSLRVPDMALRDDAHGPVTALAISLDGKSQASGSFEMIRWETVDHAPQQVKVEGETVQCLRFSDDGKYLFAATGTPGLKGRVVAIDVASGKIVQQLDAHADSILAIAISPDGSQFATGGYDRKIILWRMHEDKPLQLIQGHTGAIRSLAFSPDGNELISGSDDQTVKVWNVRTGERLDTMGQATGSVTAVGVTRDGRWIFAGSSDNRLRAWQFESKGKTTINPLRFTRFVDDTPIQRLAISADDTRLIALTAGGNLKLISTSNWLTSGSLQKVASRATDLAISPDGKEAWIARFDGETMRLPLPVEPTGNDARQESQSFAVYVDLASLQPLDESKLSPVQPVVQLPPVYPLPRGTEVSGSIKQPGEQDWYRFQAHQGEMWVVETDTRGLNSKLDSIIEIRSDDLSPLTQARLQAFEILTSPFVAKTVAKAMTFACLHGRR